MIEATALSKTYPGVVALRGVDFKIDKGEIVGLLGPNGAGKTTTMRILTSFLPPSSGGATVAGYDVIRDSMQVRQHVGYLPESNPLYPDMRVNEYLGFRASLKGLSGRERKTQVNAAIDRTGLADLKYRIVGHLSKGQRQRVGLADAIVHDPDVLILDEPTIGLDPNQIREVRNLVRELGADKTVILSTHILQEVEQMCRRIVIINCGQIVADGDIPKIAKELKLTGRIRLEIASREKGVKEEIEKLPEVLNVVTNDKPQTTVYRIQTRDQADIRSELFKLASARRWDLRELALEQLSLEDAFAQLTEKR